jgi:hypothetical protein
VALTALKKEMGFEEINVSNYISFTLTYSENNTIIQGVQKVKQPWRNAI